MNTKQLIIDGLNEDIAYCEAMGLSKCFNDYAEHSPTERIMDGGIGFNQNSGYVFIALENGITICSMLGRTPEYVITDFETGEETFFDNYTLAQNHLETLNDNEEKENNEEEIKELAIATNTAIKSLLEDFAIIKNS